jgi:hypothetical protein
MTYEWIERCYNQRWDLLLSTRNHHQWLKIPFSGENNVQASAAKDSQERNLSTGIVISKDVSRMCHTSATLLHFLIDSSTSSQ